MSAKRVTVWRYEGADGKGPYQGRDVPRLRDMYRQHGDMSTHPNSYIDFTDGKPLPETWLSACASQVKLIRWFWGYNTILKQCGFKQVRYRVEKSAVRYGMSGRQVSFDPKRAVKLGSETRASECLASPAALSNELPF